MMDSKKVKEIMFSPYIDISCWCNGGNYSVSSCVCDGDREEFSEDFI